MNCDQVFDILTRGPFPTGHPSDLEVEMHLHACGGCRRLADALRPAVELFEEAVGPEESRGLPGYWGLLAEDLRESPTLETQRRPQLAHLATPRRRVNESRPSRTVATQESPLQRNLVRVALAVVVGVACGGLLRMGLSTPGGPPPADVAEQDVDRRSLGTTPVTTALLSPAAFFDRYDMRAACVLPGEQSGPDASDNIGRESRDSSHAHNAVADASATLLTRLEHSAIQCCTHCHRATEKKADTEPRGHDLTFALASAPPIATNLVRSCGACHVQ